MWYFHVYLHTDMSVVHWPYPVGVHDVTIFQSGLKQKVKEGKLVGLSDQLERLALNYNAQNA